MPEAIEESVPGRKPMSRLTTLIVVLVSAIIAPSEVLAKSWKGITPLHSKSRDVVEQFVACDKTETRCQFTLDNDEVMIVFSGSRIGVLECPRVPKGTVLAITVKFGSPKSLKEIKPKNKRFRVFDPSSSANHGYKTYYYGFMINTFKGKVIGVVYIAEQKDVHLCAPYYEDPKAFVAVGLLP